MRKNGFSLIEVLIAGALMIGMAMGAYQVLGNLFKSTGDLEKRARYRDLINDIRFVFSEPNLCKENFERFSLNENSDITLRLSPKAELSGNTPVPEYGLKVDRLYLANVQSFPPVRKTLFRNTGEVLGNYSETAQMADIYVEASILNSKTRLKKMAAVRVVMVQRTGDITEFQCFGNHQVSAAPASNPLAFQPVSTPRPSHIASRGISGRYERKDCWVEENLRMEVGHERLVNGQIVTFLDRNGRRVTAVCNEKRFIILKKEN